MLLLPGYPWQVKLFTVFLAEEILSAVLNILYGINVAKFNKLTLPSQ